MNLTSSLLRYVLGMFYCVHMDHNFEDIWCLRAMLKVARANSRRLNLVFTVETKYFAPLGATLGRNPKHPQKKEAIGTNTNMKIFLENNIADLLSDCSIRHSWIESDSGRELAINNRRSSPTRPAIGNKPT